MSSVIQIPNVVIQTPNDRFEECAVKSAQTFVNKVHNFPAWTPRWSIQRFLAALHIYQHVIGTYGIVVECGVGGGAGLFTWMHLQAILEPNNYTRNIVGFDLAENLDVWGDLRELASIHSCTRPGWDTPVIEIVPGDAVETIPKYVESRPGMIVALLVLDFTTADPTRVALDWFYPLMPRGGVLVSGGIFREELKELPSDLAWQRCPWSPTLIWAVKP